MDKKHLKKCSTAPGPELAFPGGWAECRACVPRRRPDSRAGSRAAGARFPPPGVSGGRWVPARAAQHLRPCSSSRRGGGPTPGRPAQTAAIPVSLRPRGPPEPATMPLGLKPTCSMCKTTSSSMWKKSPQGEILCHPCTGWGEGGGGAGVVGGTRAGGGFGTATFATASAGPSQSNGGGGGKQSKQEIHRRSARLKNTKYKSAPAAEKKVSTKGKGRRHIFKLKNPIKAPESVSTIVTAESIFYKGVYFQIGNVVSVIDEQDGKPYYAQIRGFIQDQY